MIQELRTPNDIVQTCELARLIWTEHFTPVIGRPQVLYMLEKFQSFDAIQSQMATDGYRYFLLRDESDIRGYLAVKPEEDTLFLSKFYLRRDCRGKGEGKRMMAFVEALGRKAGLNSIRLTVNRHNQVAIDFYRAYGFESVGTQVTDVGNGFVMDDYVMRLSLPG